MAGRGGRGLGLLQALREKKKQREEEEAVARWAIEHIDKMHLQQQQQQQKQQQSEARKPRVSSSLFLLSLVHSLRVRRAGVLTVHPSLSFSLFLSLFSLNFPSINSI